MATSGTADTKEHSGHELTEIRWHARGGQGAVTAAKLVAELALGQGKYFQAFPEYGPERSGAPIVAFTRVSDEPIQVYCGIEHPRIVVVLDASLLSVVDVTKGAPDDAVVLVNSEMSPAELRKQHGIKGGRLFTIAATRIATETIRRPIPNTPMVGALTRITGPVPHRQGGGVPRATSSARSSPRRWSRATSRPSPAATRRSRANERRQEAQMGHQ